MNVRPLLSLGTAVLAFGAVALGGAALVGTVAEAGVRSPDELAARAAKALARKDPAAVSLAEQAVAAAPGEASYRALLGRAYLQAGRFASARDAFGDALRLRPSDGRSALNLALATIATGDWQSARATLAAHQGDISPADRGLAIALAGDPVGATAILTQAARAPDADAKTRQNLALALALSGQWSMARAIAAADMSPADVDVRLAQWMQFAQPVAASDQVASLLGVRAVPDQGQPVALALASPVAPAPTVAPAMTAAAEPVVTMPQSAPAETLAAAIAAAPASVAPAPVAQAAVVQPPLLAAAGVTFGPRREVVQPLPVALIRAPGPIKSVARSMAAPTPRTTAIAGAVPARGEWHVQLGAFSNAGVAHDAWGRLSRRYAGIGSHVPQGASYRVGDDALYRLSVGGFDHAGAERMCRSVRSAGGTCFIRRAAGDAVAQWARGNTQLASR